MTENPESTEDTGSAEDVEIVEDADATEVDGVEDIARDEAPDEARKSRLGLGLAAAFFVAALVLAVAVFYGSQDPETPAAGGGETTEPVGMSMAGPVVDVNVSEEALASEPEAPDLSTPEAAVRSYIDWTSYAYRTAQSQAALPTMSTYQEVHVDSYIQYNIQKSRLLDQTIVELEFGEITVEGDTATVPVKEAWKYSYVSIEEAGEVIGGPYEIEYDAVYSLLKTESGDWVVDSVDATALGEVQ
ncbi:MAG: hypothetical protein Q7W51_05675 [Coriobacteriia bacterium]|nr:hypothetical protein [Coriobacteriia bacterium]